MAAALAAPDIAPELFEAGAAASAAAMPPAKRERSMRDEHTEHLMDHLQGYLGERARLRQDQQEASPPPRTQSPPSDDELRWQAEEQRKIEERLSKHATHLLQETQRLRDERAAFDAAQTQADVKMIKDRAAMRKCAKALCDAAQAMQAAQDAELEALRARSAALQHQM